MCARTYLALSLVAYLTGITSPGWAQTKDSIGEDLQRSQFCAKAAKDFRNAPEWKEMVKSSLSLTFTSHFNKAMGKCLVKVESRDPVPNGGYIESSHVYDALENTVLGGKVVTRKDLKKDLLTDKDARIVMIRGGKIITDKQGAAEAFYWYDTLMRE